MWISHESYYIIRPLKHSAFKCHKLTSCKLSNLWVTTTTSSIHNSSDCQIIGTTGSSLGISDKGTLTSTVTKKQKTITVAPKMLIVENKKWPDVQGNVTMNVKHKKQLTFKPINVLIDHSVSRLRSCTDTMKKGTQTACFSFVLSGGITKVSNYTAVEFYK